MVERSFSTCKNATRYDNELIQFFSFKNIKAVLHKSYLKKKNLLKLRM